MLPLTSTGTITELQPKSLAGHFPSNNPETHIFNHNASKGLLKTLE